MAVYYRTKGFVFNKTDWREADQLFSIFTEDYGRIEILGRAIRKISSKLRSGIDLFYLSEIEFIQGRVYKTLTDAVAINKYNNIRRDLEKIETAFQIINPLGRLIKGQEIDKRIWFLINEIFNKLNSSQPIDPVRQGKVYYYFFWNLLSVLGYQIDAYDCVFCAKKLVPLKLYFSPERNGLVCAQCFDKTDKRVDVSLETIKIIRILLENGSNIIDRLKIDISHLAELRKFSDYYLENLSV